MKNPTSLRNTIINGIIFIVLSIFIYALVEHFFFQKNKTQDTSVIEIQHADSLLLINSKGFKPDNFDKKQKPSSNTINYTYEHILSLEHFQNEALETNAKFYYLKLKEINETPELIETRVNRIKVELANHYELRDYARLVSLKFKNIVHFGRKYKFQFALFKNGTYEDFGNENTLNMNLALGRKSFFIRAIDFESKTVTKPVEISFNSALKISKKTWFWPLMIFTFFFTLFLFFYRIKINQKESIIQQKLALEQQRSKITADLHDDIGASLSSLQINSLVAGTLLTKDPLKAKEVLDKIEEQSKNLAESLGDLIWSMKPGKEEILDFGYKIKNFANDILGASNIKYEINIDKDINQYLLEIQLRKNLIYIAKEALNNAAKYSKATEIHLNCHKTKDSIQLEIIDNGVGFNRNNANGNGLKNIENRVLELNGTFELISRPGEGCQIIVNIPLSLDLGTK